MSTPFVIAIDGPAASGKGTLARRLAQHLNFSYMDTGALYRATARDTLRAIGTLEDEAAAAECASRLDPATLDDPALKGEEAGRGASIVAAYPAVRAALLALQRGFAARPPSPAGAVLDGRDIGTVVCPEARLKLFITASPEARARRRYLEETARGGSADETRILAEVRERDARDAERATAPLKAASDAVVIDTSHMDAEAVFLRALALVKDHMAKISETEK